ncbi:transcriptional regulator, XRE family [Gloeothece citriformis PCC 7424]|uniref:Transcriptional regulator, XRE family n=1 Tax=Gloeothece citriformis (strain PCC 7424) TaxID=65393 RepID=B7KIN8_GLOC7|nr:nucleotide exchange factor GrpE [Gloeothece citriformis]ACK69444.1 transcriptional regulator, XRE family [Gloeothece citriformis PCC 7424]
MNESLYHKNRQQLEDLMHQVGISSLKELSRLSGVSEWQLIRLEYGLILKIPVEILLKLSHTLNISLNDLLSQFDSGEVVSTPQLPEMGENTEELQALKQDYQRLQQQMEQQRESLTQEFQRLQQEMAQQKETLKEDFQQTSLQTLESWLVQWPTAAVSAQKNPKLPALKLLPLLKPMAMLLKQWGVEAIASVGELVPYDPHYHQLIQGEAQPGERVRVRYVGYRQGDKLLYRAKVSPIEPQPSPKLEENEGENESHSSPTTALDVPQTHPTTVLDVSEEAAAESESSPTTFLDVSEDDAVNPETSENMT